MNQLKTPNAAGQMQGETSCTSVSGKQIVSTGRFLHVRRNKQLNPEGICCFPSGITNINHPRQRKLAIQKELQLQNFSK